MTKRIFIDTNRVTMSKPGYDAQSPPAVDYRYLSLDSRLDTGRPLEIRLLPNHSLVADSPIYFTTTYAGVPAVDIFLYNSLGFYNKSNWMKDDNGSRVVHRTSFYLAIWNDHFVASDFIEYVRSVMFGNTYYGLYYIAWKAW